MCKMPYLLMILFFSTTASAYDNGEVDEKLYSHRIDSLNKVLAQLKRQLNYVTFDVILNDAEINQKILPVANITNVLKKEDTYIDSLWTGFEKKEQLFESMLMQNDEYKDFISTKINVKKFDTDEYYRKRSQLIFEIRNTDPALGAIFNERTEYLYKANLTALKKYIKMCKDKKIQISISLSDFQNSYQIINDNPECFEIQQKVKFIGNLIRFWTSALYDPKAPRKKDEIIEPPKNVDYNETLIAIDTLNREIKSLKYSLNYLSYRLLLDEIFLKEDYPATFQLTKMMGTRDEEIKNELEKYEIVCQKEDSIKMRDSDFRYLMTKGFSQERYPNMTRTELIRKLYVRLRQNKEFCVAEKEKIDFIGNLNRIAIEKYVDLVVANHGFIRIDAISNKLSYTVKNSSDYSEIESNINLLLKKKASLERSLYELIR